MQRVLECTSNGMWCVAAVVVVVPIGMRFQYASVYPSKMYESRLDFSLKPISNHRINSKYCNMHDRYWSKTVSLSCCFVVHLFLLSFARNFEIASSVNTTTVRVRLKCILNFEACFGAAADSKTFLKSMLYIRLPSPATAIHRIAFEQWQHVWYVRCMVCGVWCCYGGECAHPSRCRCRCLLFLFYLGLFLAVAVASHSMCMQPHTEYANIAYDSDGDSDWTIRYTYRYIRMHACVRPSNSNSVRFKSYNIPVGFVWLVSHMPAS